MVLCKCCRPSQNDSRKCKITGSTNSRANTTHKVPESQDRPTVTSAATDLF